MLDVLEFFNLELSIGTGFDESDGSLFSIVIGVVDIVPLLVEFVGDFDGFMDVVVFGFKIIRSELYLHTIGFPWPLEYRQASVSGFREGTIITIFGHTSNS